jgi:Asp/Glu/hydantoin racemase
MSCIPRISLIHATSLAIAPIGESFRHLWSNATVRNLLDDSLTADLEAANGDISAMIPRFNALTSYAISTGAHGILFTCSAFGPAIDAVRAKLSIPVLKPNEAMISEALALGSRIALLATFEPALAPITDEFYELARTIGRNVELRPLFVKDAWAALQRGDAARHDQLVAAACGSTLNCDVICFAQFSMTSAAATARVTAGRPVLTTPDSAVMRLKTLMNHADPPNRSLVP